MRTRRRARFTLILIIVALAAAAVALMPWAFHMGNRPTPFLTWFGSGALVAEGGATYPIFVMLYPASHFSRLALLDGTRPSGGIQGNACICTAPGVSQYVKISGTLYGGWRSTDGSRISFRLLEPTPVNFGQALGGYFDLSGRWAGQELVLHEGARYSRTFRSGLNIQHASVTLTWHPYWTCKSACERAFQKE